MPHGQFKAITVKGDHLIVTGTSHEVSAISLLTVTIIAVDPSLRGKSAQVKIDPKVAKLGPTWPAELPCDTGSHFGKFTEGEEVVVVGVATHNVEDHPKPFRWTGFFIIPAEGKTALEASATFT